MIKKMSDEAIFIFSFHGLCLLDFRLRSENSDLFPFFSIPKVYTSYGLFFPLKVIPISMHEYLKWFLQYNSAVIYHNFSKKDGHFSYCSMINNICIAHVTFRSICAICLSCCAGYIFRNNVHLCYPGYHGFYICIIFVKRTDAISVYRPVSVDIFCRWILQILFPSLFPYFSLTHGMASFIKAF